MAYRGSSLRALREGKSIQLSRIAADTRITTWYLSAIEEERFDRFPGRFYFKSFTAEYARSLGLDPSEVLQDLQVAYDDWMRRRSGENQSSRPEPSTGLFAKLTGRLRKSLEV